MPLRFPLALLLSLLVACGSDQLPEDGGAQVDSAPPSGACLVDGTTRCDGTLLVVCRDGAWADAERCATTCDATLGCVACPPGTAVCTRDGDSERCLPDGSGHELEACDPVQGSSCDLATGRCTGPCARDNLGTSYLGCEYFPTVTGNAVPADFEFAVVLSNQGDTVAQIVIEDGALLAPLALMVAPRDLVVQRIPWVHALKACPDRDVIDCGAAQNSGALVTRGAYHLRSTQPISVYQFSPLDYKLGDRLSYSNDASLLLPTHVWSGRYVTASHASWTGVAPWPSQLAITALANDTTVTITTRANTPGGLGSPPFAVGVPQSVGLHRGDALQLMAPAGDLTGSLIYADRPVQVISGHYCAMVPWGYAACDHIEESMFPVATLSTKYVVTSPAVPIAPKGREQVVRIIATEADTTLVYDPPQPLLPTTLRYEGAFLETQQNASDFQITTDKRVLVAQYMEGQFAPGSGGTGDPAMALAVATDQYRTRYLFHAPTNYELNYVNVTAPTGAAITLDGAPVGGFVPVGGSGFGVAKVQLGQGVNGNHTITGDALFGISVYGYGQYTSYWYPGGLDLATIPIE
ncbi:MAG: hypothetical protein EXR73_01875 [Myxococcales bacterium]|nr:hypothetical protein [Myxococcales bacterium]